MTYEYYRKKPMSLCEITLNQISFRNSIIGNCFNRNNRLLLIRKQSIIEINDQFI